MVSGWSLHQGQAGESMRPALCRVAAVHSPPAWMVSRSDCCSLDSALWRVFDIRKSILPQHR